MVYAAHVVHVLIASPSDVSAERKALRTALWEFNDEHTPSSQTVLLPRTWEENSTPRLGADPQTILDEQIVDTSDIAIGIFWTRIGQLLEDGTPATVHELERFVAAGKPALLYFSNMPVVPTSLDAEQWAGVQAFKQEARSWGLYREYSDLEELVVRARRDLLATVHDHLKLPQVENPSNQLSSARPVAAIERDFQNRPSLVVQNLGTATANSLRIEWLPVEDDEYGREPPMSHGLDRPVRSLIPGGRVEFSLLLHSGTVDMADLAMRWKDDQGRESETVQTLAF